MLVHFLFLKITFVLEEQECPGTYPTFFIVRPEGLGEHRFNITCTQTDCGEAAFQLPLVNPVFNISHLVIYGGNDAGYVEICTCSGGKT